MSKGLFRFVALYTIHILGNLLVSLCCIISLTSNMANLNVVLGQFSFQTIIMVCNSHNLLMMINKWIQACMASSGTSTVSAPVRYIFFTFLFVVWSINLGKYLVLISVAYFPDFETGKITHFPSEKTRKTEN